MTLIKQLALEADEYCRDYVPNWTMDDYNKKFAELIVRQCCQEVERKYKYSNGTPVSFWEMSQDVQDLLKEHFGVEE